MAARPPPSPPTIQVSSLTAALLARAPMCIVHSALCIVLRCALCTTTYQEIPNSIILWLFFSTAKIDNKSKTKNLYVREFQADLKSYTSKLNVQNGRNGQNSKSKMVMNLEHLI